jgi:hypothetical protein
MSNSAARTAVYSGITQATLGHEDGPPPLAGPIVKVLTA